MRDVDRVQLVRDAWSAVSRGDLGALELLLAPDASWRAVEDGPWNCEGRPAIIEVMTRNLDAGRLSGHIEDAFEHGGGVVVAFRPDKPDGWPLDDGVRYLVVSVAGDHVTELKGCANRRVALDYAASR